MTPRYELLDVSRHYGSGGTLVTAVDSIDLRIEPGEFVVVGGPSGSGKTTLLQLLGALDRPTGGEVLFDGRDLDDLSDGALAELRRSTLGFIFQQFNLIPTLTAAENVEAALAPNGRGAASRHSRSRELLERVKLGHRADHLPSQLSGGEQQRVAIARALANEPTVLMADEPTGNLDSKTGAEVIDLLRRLWQGDGLTVVLVTHDPSIADREWRLVRMSDGRVVSSQSEPTAA